MVNLKVLLPLVALVAGTAIVVVQRTRDPQGDVTIVAPGRPAIAIPLPPFSLTDQEGKPFSLDSMRGKVWVASFVFTRCPAICPRTMERSVALLGQTRDLEALRFLTVTVDPENDDAPAMKAYGSRFGVDFDRWALVTGDFREIEKTVLQGFKVAMGKDDTGAIVHAERFVLVDAAGRIRGYYDQDEAGQRDLLEAARRLVAAL